MGAAPYFVKELETGCVVIGDDQHFYGCTLFLCKEHGNKTELFHLDTAERLKFLEEMSVVAEAVSKAFGAKTICENRAFNARTTHARTITKIFFTKTLKSLPPPAVTFLSAWKTTASSP